MNDQDERHELLGRLETPPEFKDWASNTLPTPGISNGHQTMAEGRGTSEHETSQLYFLSQGQRTPVVFPEGAKKVSFVPPAPVPTPRPPGGVHGLPLEIQDSQRDGEILGNSGLGKF